MSGDSGVRSVRFRSDTFSVPRRGHTAAQNEDAAAGPRRRASSILAAVADGATESAFAGRWARILAEEFVRNFRPDEPPEAWLGACRSLFLKDAEAEHPPDPWYLEHKRREGAFAALAGVVIAPGVWSGHAVGDCCIIHTNAERRILHAWPLASPEDFHHRPELLGTEGPMPPWAFIQHGWSRGDALLLATDAAAAWLLACGRDAALPEFHQIGTSAQRARDNGEMRNDDLTILSVTDLR